MPQHLIRQRQFLVSSTWSHCRTVFQLPPTAASQIGCTGSMNNGSTNGADAGIIEESEGPAPGIMHAVPKHKPLRKNYRLCMMLFFP